MEYGTAGFRAKADLLDTTVYRMGLLAAARSRSCKGKVIGVMITASHNPPQDNGVKLIDPMGQMLATAWEPTATELANAADLDAAYAKLPQEGEAQVAIARDTRESGPKLYDLLKQGLEKAGAKVHEYNVLTTPMLHYMVRCLNDPSFGSPTEEGYYKKLSTAFAKIGEQCEITVDTANGVGGPKLADIAKCLDIKIDIRNNSDDPKLLNHDCGADFVKTNQRLPSGITTVPNKLYCSFDGDADRIIFYYVDENNQFNLLDGDRIASLAASFITELVQQSGTNLKIGVVQTAYANGSSTEYLTKTLGLPVECTKTGVKHLHAAAEKFDIGVYFEANGHGTVLFDQQAIHTLQTVQVSSPGQKTAVDSLLALSDLINQTVGDSISDMLLVLAVLSIKKWTPSDWHVCYTDLPNRLMKCEVNDRSRFVATDAERKLAKPDGLQAQIDALICKYSQGRSFVRPSGTENVVRIYAEASSRTQADDLALKVQKLVEQS